MSTQAASPRAARPQRVLFVLNSLRAGGAEKQVLMLLEHLDTAQFTLGLVYLRRIEQLLPQVPAQRLARLTCCDTRRYFDLGAIRRLAAAIDQFAADVVVCTNMWSLFNVGLARPFARSCFRTVEVFHTTVLHTLKQRLQLWCYRPLFARSDLLVYVCNGQRDYWRGHGLRARAEAVIHNGIDTALYQDRWPTGEKQALRRTYGFAPPDFVIGLCAVFRAEKAHGDLLRALAGLRARGVPAKALLIGDGPMRASVERHARALGIAEHVRITGFQQDVRPLIAICDVMTLMSHAIETFSIAALEAMAMGKPMVMTRIGGAEEQVQDGVNGFLFSPGDIDTCVHRLMQLFEAPRRQRMGAAAMACVRERFSLRQMILAYGARLHDLPIDSADASVVDKSVRAATRARGR